jgi:hypothetical protein
MDYLAQEAIQHRKKGMAKVVRSFNPPRSFSVMDGPIRYATEHEPNDQYDDMS